MAIATAGASIDLAAGGADSAPAAVRRWLYGLAGLVVAMVAVGGATRLTGSGLSITEWRPVTGAIPPLSDAAWLVEFAKYKASPQYALLNQGMSLAEFQFIYWWEWAHRQLGRLIGLMFFLPFLWFWARGALSRRLALTLLAIGALGGLQGAVGWIMVASGLKPGMTAVAPIKLTLHLLLAGAILAALLWVATGLNGAARSLREPREHSAHGLPPSRLGLRPDRPRRARRRLEGGACLQQLAADGWRVGAVARRSFRRAPLDRELRRQCRPGAAQPSPRRLSRRRARGFPRRAGAPRRRRRGGLVDGTPRRLSRHARHGPARARHRDAAPRRTPLGRSRPPDPGDGRARRRRSFTPG